LYGGLGSGSLGQIRLNSVVVAANIAPTGPDANAIMAADNSFVGTASGVLALGGSNNIVDEDAKLGPLANNGGPKLTHRPLPGRPAINEGSNPANLLYDQRGPGFARVLGGAADIGAVETSYPPSVRNVVINNGDPQRSRVTSVAVTFDQLVSLPANPADAFQL